MRMKRILTMGATIGFLTGQDPLTWAAEPDAFQFFQEEAQVITASRRSQSISEVPLAVDVITAEEIKTSGAVNIWDLLRFRVGMDVLDARSSDGSRAIVSSRGFPHEHASNFLVLVDGRSVSDANSAGVMWEQLPVQLQDIERIEIVRGPNTALYGTGAGFGVANIITKKPQGKPTLELDNRGGNLGLVQSYQAVNGSVKGLSLKVSHTFQQQHSFPTASNTAIDGDDFLHKNVVNLRSAMPLWGNSNLDLFTGGSWETLGLGQAGSSQRGEFNNHFQMVKLSHVFSKDSSMEVTGARNDSINDAPVSNLSHDLRELQYDAEILHRFAWWNSRLHTTYGTSYRHMQVTSPQIYGSLTPSPRIEIYRGYLQQTVKIADPLSLQGGVSLEATRVAGVKPNYQIASIWSPLPEHAFRASYSLAYTLHDLMPTFARWDFFSGTYMLGNPEVASNPYRIQSYETGYHGMYLNDHLLTDINLFYMKIDNNHQTFSVSPFFTSIQFQNYDDAIARGTEMELKYHFSSARWVYANYTYEHITDTAGDRAFITENTPSHKLNFGGSTDLGHGFTASANVGYKDAYYIVTAAKTPILSIPAYWRLDARLAYAVNTSVELYIAGQNLAATTHQEFPDGLAIPRTYQGGVSMKFGGSHSN
jgi:iron complex outermembrane recepter protein